MKLVISQDGNTIINLDMIDSLQIYNSSESESIIMAYNGNGDTPLTARNSNLAFIKKEFNNILELWKTSESFVYKIGG